MYKFMSVIKFNDQYFEHNEINREVAPHFCDATLLP